MPTAAAKPCGSPVCGVLVRDGSGYCAKHKRQVRRVEQKRVDERRESSTKRGYGYKWQKARAGHLRSHPLCEDHLALGQYVQATVVDHKVPHRLGEAQASGDADRIAAAQKLFWDRGNWQSQCKTCHDRKTASEDGGFGNPRSPAG